MAATLRKYALIVLFALMAYFGYRPMKEVVLGLRGVTYAADGLSCDYQGRTYHETEQRQADDGCNVCTCSTTGWNCTKIACTGGAGTGTITGTLSSPDGSRVPAQRVCAANLERADEMYCQQTTDGTSEFAIAAKPGDYWVYAERVDDESGKRAYWSEYVKCGKTPTCKNHSPISVRVAPGEISQARPEDWKSNAQIDLLNITPSKWEYTTHNYYPDSVFLVKGRGLSRVRLFATPYPEKPGATPYELGEATLKDETESVQVWTLPIPKGFQAWTAYVVGENSEGETVQSYALRIIRPIETTY